MSYENHWMRDVEAIIRKERKELVEEFLADLQKAWDQTIDREINLGLQAKFHYPINDNYHALKKKWEGKLNTKT